KMPLIILDTGVLANFSVEVVIGCWIGECSVLSDECTVSVKCEGGAVILIPSDQLTTGEVENYRVGGGCTESPVSYIKENLNDVFLVLMVSKRDFKLHEIFMGTQFTLYMIEVFGMLYFRCLVDDLLAVFFDLIVGIGV